MSAQAAVAPAFIPTHRAEPDFDVKECLGMALVVDDNPDITAMLAAGMRCKDLFQAYKCFEYPLLSGDPE